MLVFEPGIGRYDLDADVVRFLGLADGGPIKCAVSRDALQAWGSRQGMAADAPEAIYQACHSQVQNLARRKFADGITDAAGHVVVTSNDLNG